GKALWCLERSGPFRGVRDGARPEGSRPGSREAAATRRRNERQEMPGADANGRMAGACARRSMRILFCNYEYPPIGGGGGVVNAALEAELAEGVQVTVRTPRAHASPQTEQVDGAPVGG